MRDSVVANAFMISALMTASRTKDSVAIISNGKLREKTHDAYDSLMIAAIKDAMVQRGFTQVANNQNPDLGINVNNIINSYTGYVDYGNYYNDYYGYWDPYYWGYPGYGYYGSYIGTYQVNEGVISIDMFDLKDASANTRIKSVWNGVVRGEVGIETGSQAFYQKYPRQLYKTADGGDLSAVVSNSVQTAPILLKAQYNLMPNRMIQPFVALATGGNIITYDQYAGEFSNDAKTKFGFAARPEAGVSWIKNMLVVKEEQMYEKIYRSMVTVGNDLMEQKGTLPSLKNPKFRPGFMMPSDQLLNELLKPSTIAKNYTSFAIEEKLKKAFEENGIKDTHFEFAISSTIGLNTYELKSDNLIKVPSGSEYENLMPEETMILVVPDIKKSIFRQLRWLMIGAILFTLIICSAFYVTVSALLRQKKTSEIKNDFINNMTHEFKTPLATISLAVDAMRNEKVLQDREKMGYFSSIIKEENRRMNKQVETILQASLMERQEIQLNKVPIHVHEVIDHVLENFHLQLEDKNGKTVLHLNAGADLIEGDEVHFTNLISNLVDNAVKYSKDNLVIKISTINTGRHIQHAGSNIRVLVTRLQAEYLNAAATWFLKQQPCLYHTGIVKHQQAVRWQPVGQRVVPDNVFRHITAHACTLFVPAYPYYKREIEDLPDHDDDNRKLKKYFNYGVATAELDSANRLLLPANLKDYAGLTKDVVLSCSKKRIEIWDKSGYHVPVLLRETLDGLAIQPGGIYVDCTFGGGGHAKALLQQLNADGRLFVFDQDADAAKNVPADDRVTFVPNNFRHLQRFMRLHKTALVDGIMADLGVSSHQFDEAERGFSTRFDAELDMRMDRRQALTAFEVVNTYTELQLHTLFEQYGEVTNAKTLARTIVAVRASTSLKTISNFKAALHTVVKGNPNKYFAQTPYMLTTQQKEAKKDWKRLLNYQWIVKNIPYFLFLSLLAVVYIYNGHYSDNTVKDINRTSKELKELQYEYKSLKSEVMFRSKQSELAKAVEPLGLKELVQPPLVLKDSTGSSH
ncbi:S-adenosyl-methyltransferase MraW [Ostertagia ostertagi]